MEIVLRENEWVCDMINNHELGKNVRETLRRAARFYKDGGLKPSAIKKKLMDFLSSCDCDHTTDWKINNIDDAVKRAAKQPAIEIESVSISATELERINALSGKQTKRLAFALLCIAKYGDIVKEGNDHWVNMPDKDIMRMANINTSLDRQGFLYWTLRENGLVQFSKKVDGLGTKVLFADNEEPVLHISDFRNLGFQYQKYLGDPYFVCTNCGITVKVDNPRVGRKQKYCKECAVKIAVQQRVNAVMDHNKSRQQIGQT